MHSCQGDRGTPEARPAVFLTRGTSSDCLRKQKKSGWKTGQNKQGRVKGRAEESGIHSYRKKPLQSQKTKGNVAGVSRRWQRHCGCGIHMVHCVPNTLYKRPPFRLFSSLRTCEKDQKRASIRKNKRNNKARRIWKQRSSSAELAILRLPCREKYGVQKQLKDVDNPAAESITLSYRVKGIQGLIVRAVAVYQVAILDGELHPARLIPRRHGTLDHCKKAQSLNEAHELFFRLT